MQGGLPTGKRRIRNLRIGKIGFRQSDLVYLKCIQELTQVTDLILEYNTHWQKSRKIVEKTNLVFLDPWVLGPLVFWTLGFLEPQVFCFLGLFGPLGFWIFGFLDLWGLDPWVFGPLGFWTFGSSFIILNIEIRINHTSFAN